MLAAAAVVNLVVAVVLAVAVAAIIAASAVVAAAPDAVVPKVWSTVESVQNGKLGSITRLSQDVLDEVQGDVVGQWRRELGA